MASVTWSELTTPLDVLLHYLADKNTFICSL